MTRLLAIKQRSWRQGLIVLGAELAMLEAWVHIPSKQWHAIESTWPGPTTWLLPARDNVSALLRGQHNTVAVRVSPHPVVQALCRSAGHALISTSANIHGKPIARNSYQLTHHFYSVVDMIVPGKPGPFNGPSMIRDGRTGKIIRA